MILLAAVLLAGTGPVSAEAGFQFTANGALYIELVDGAGEPAEKGDIATMHYTGRLDNGSGRGREYYNSRSENSPVSFVIGTERVMPGWNEGVIGMRKGGRRLVKVPPELGYGSVGVEGIIPSNSGLVLLIELIDLEKRNPD